MVMLGLCPSYSMYSCLLHINNLFLNEYLNNLLLMKYVYNLVILNVACDQSRGAFNTPICHCLVGVMHKVMPRIHLYMPMYDMRFNFPCSLIFFLFVFLGSST